MKKRWYVIIILGIALICMLPNSLANVAFFDDFDDGSISDWTKSTTGSGSVSESSDQYHTRIYSMYITSPTNPASKAWATSPTYTFDSDSSYNVSMYLYLPNLYNHWMYVCKNGQINCIIEDFTEIVVWYSGSTHTVMYLNDKTWYHIEFKVDHSDDTYDVYVDGVNKLTANFDSSSATSYLRMGDNEATSLNFGSMYIDNIKLEQSGSTCFYDDFNDGSISDWTISTAGNGSVTTSTSQYLAWSLYINSPKYTSSKAWAISPTYIFDDTESYTVSMYIYLPNTNNHWFYICVNGHIKCFIDWYNHLKVWYDSSAHSVMYITTETWYFIEFEVNPSIEKYDIFINGVNKHTADFEHSSASSYIRMGDNEVGSSNYGSMYWDDVRVDQ